MRPRQTCVAFVVDAGQASGTSYDLSDVDFVNATTGWATGHAAGDGGGPQTHVLIHTTDGGVTWVTQALPTGVRAYHADGLFFRTTQEGWISGKGTIIHTTDGGATWQFQDSLYGGKAIDFVNADDGWTAGYNDDVSHTSDGGASWLGAVCDPSVASLNDVQFVDAQTGWVVGYRTGDPAGYGTVQRTTDGGQSWADTTIPDAVTSVQFVDAADGWIVAGPTIYRSTDGGATWQAQLQSSSTYTTLDFSSATNGWAVGPNGGMRQTTDGGAHWLRRDTSATNSDLTAIDMADASNGWAIGPVGLAHTTDGGATWTSQDCGAGSDKLLTVSAIDASNAWVGGEWGLLRRTTDGGATWQSYDRSVDDGNVNSVQFINSSTGWVGCAYAGFHTTDGGASWTWDDLPGSCVFTDANDGWGCSYAHVGRTTDGGASWSYTVLPGAYYTSSDVAFGDPEHGIAVCKYAVPCQAWRTDDGGATWTAIDWAAQNLAVTPNFDRIAMVGTSAWCFGGTTVLHTGDGGVTWDSEDTGLVDPRGGDFTDDQHGWVVGDNGAILATSDGGAVDTQAPVTTSPQLDGAWHNDPVVVLQGHDDISGVRTTEYKVGSATNWTTGDHVTLPEGTTTLTYRSTDKSGNVEVAKTSTARIDLTPPVTTADGFDSAWHTTPVTVTLSPSDEGSGVASTSWTVDGPQGGSFSGTTATVAAPADGSNDGVHTVTWWSTDNAGNVETQHSAQVKIDTQGPVTTDDFDGSWQHGDVTVHLLASDGGSGVGATYYAIDGGAEVEGTTVPIPGPADHSNDGTHTVTYYSVDAVGNRGATGSVDVKIDTTPIPSIVAGHTKTNRATASWTFGAPWSTRGVEVSNSTTTEPGGNFTSVADSCGFYGFDGPWTSGASQPLHPGTYYVHLELYNTKWGQYCWTPVSSFTIPKTAKPKITWKAGAARYVISSGQLRLKVRWPLVVTDDSLGRMQIRLTEERKVGGKVVASSVRTFSRPSPRSLGAGRHTYSLTFLRSANCDGRGTYIVRFRVQDQEYNWSNTSAGYWNVPA